MWVERSTTDQSPAYRGASTRAVSQARNLGRTTRVLSLARVGMFRTCSRWVNGETPRTHCQPYRPRGVPRPWSDRKSVRVGTEDPVYGLNQRCYVHFHGRNGGDAVPWLWVERSTTDQRPAYRGARTRAVFCSPDLGRTTRVLSLARVGMFTTCSR